MPYQHGQQPPPPPPSSPSRPKREQQKDYRDEERACIDTLRIILEELTNGDYKSRHEVLTAAIRVLKIVLDSGRGLPAAPAGLSVPPVSVPANGGGMASRTMGHPTPYFPPDWQPDPGVDAAPYAYTTDQQYYTQSGSQGAGGSFDYYPAYPGSQGADNGRHYHRR